MRETVVFSALNVPAEEWQEDPYDPLHQCEFMRNRADSPEYDAQFPDHPLSKVRSYLAELAGQLEVAPAISTKEPFKYRKPGAGFWSRLWQKGFG
ncbi:hypothetical protein [Pseudoduganella sp. HUAS MS19]